MERKLEDWTKALKEAATAGSGERLPDELWQRISARLDAMDGKPAARRGRIYAWTASAAAAAAVILLGIFLLRTPAGKGPENTTAADSGPLPVDTAILGGITDKASAPEGDAVLLSDASAVDTPAAPRLSKAAAPAKNVVAAKIMEPADIYKESETVPDAAAAATPAKEEIKETPSAAPAEKEGSVLPARVEKEAAAAASAAGITPVEPAGRVNKRSPSGREGGLLAFSGGGIGSGSRSVSRAEGNVTPPYAATTDGNPVLLPDTNGFMVSAGAIAPPDPEQYSYRHRQPLTFAIAFDFPVGHNLYVGAGVSYTNLSSTATSSISGKEFDQKLQYVGIPVTFKWAFVNTKVVTLYAGAGVQPEFCVDARFGGERVDVATLQLSASLLAGAQLNLGKHIGIYAEPRLSHYFMKTELETVRNTKSVNFNLEFGLRFRY